MDTDPRAANIEQLFTHGSFGQIHARRLNADISNNEPTLICLHPAPYSGLYFTTVMPLLNENRCVIAPDYPGFGSSTATANPPTISDYAVSIIELIDALAIPGDQAVDLLGFHTGCLVAAEIALQEPSLTRRLVLVDIPYFETGERNDMYAKAAQPRNLTDQANLEDNWNFNITSRLETMSFDRAFDLFVEQLRPGALSHWGFHAAFSWPADERLPKVAPETLIIATDSSLSEATQNAAEIMPDAEFRNRPGIKSAVFESSAQIIADEAIDWLDH